MNKMEIDEAWRRKEFENKKLARADKDKAETSRLEQFFDVSNSKSTANEDGTAGASGHFSPDEIDALILL